MFRPSKPVSAEGKEDITEFAAILIRESPAALNLEQGPHCRPLYIPARGEQFSKFPLSRLTALNPMASADAKMTFWRKRFHCSFWEGVVLTVGVASKRAFCAKALRVGKSGSFGRTWKRMKIEERTDKNHFSPLLGCADGNRSWLIDAAFERGNGSGRDNQRWPNAYFSAIGLLSLGRVMK